MDHITELYCLVDDFYKSFEPHQHRFSLTNSTGKRQRKTDLSYSELMTLSILFHQLRYRQFKSFYLDYACRHLKAEFPSLPSYSRCISLLPRITVPLTLLLHTLKGSCSGISIADATSLAVCDNRRIQRHRVFDGYAARGKTSMGWFFGFKLHVVINHSGELIAFRLTPGNVDDRKALAKMADNIHGKLFADKGYIAQWLSQMFSEQQCELITTLRKNMKAVTRSAFDNAILSRRGLVETVFDELKNLCQIEHSRHRSVGNFIVNLLGGLIAYCLMPKKPSLSITTTNAVITR
jgi:transposase